MDGSIALNGSNIETPRILIVGSGFAGLGMAIKLKAAGINDFVLLEKDSGVGGTWRVNNYPGCACDVQSHLYSFSFAPNPHWSRMFSPQPEIRGYLEACAERFGITPHIRFNTAMARGEWLEARKLWRVSTSDGRIFEAPIFIPAIGGLSTPALPEIAGLASFKGEVFHSQQWRHDYDLKGKRVAVIGTGASAIQFVPQIQEQVAQLDLYQRTPPWIIGKPDRAILAAERSRFARIPALQKAWRAGLYGMMEARALAFTVNPKLMKIFQKLAVAFIHKQVKDPALRAKLTPDYTIGCKRVLISNDYYPALGKPNVEVITQGVQAVRAHSVIDAEGVERKVDAIILGTGFAATNPVPENLLIGRDGADLGKLWQAGPEAYKGSCINGFPNLFMIVGPNTGLGHNSMVYMIESQIAYVMDALKVMAESKLATVEVKSLDQNRYNAGLQARHKNTIWSTGGCKSWYVHPKSGKNTSLWPGFTFAFRAITRSFDLGAYNFTAQLQSHQPAHSASEEVIA